MLSEFEVGHNVTVEATISCSKGPDIFDNSSVAIETSLGSLASGNFVWFITFIISVKASLAA